MNIINIKVDFTKRKVEKDGVKLVEGDYNSTKLVFEFDKEYEGRKIFEMAKPDTEEAIFVKEIIDNEIVLVGKVEVKDSNGYIQYKDENENKYWYDEEHDKIYDTEYVEQTEIDIEDLTKVLVDGSIFDEEGRWPFEISLYDGDSKLTSAYSGLNVAREMIKIGQKKTEAYLPIFDQMMADLNQATDEANNLNISRSKSGRVATITITKKDGTTEEVELYDGEQGPQGQPGYTPQKGIDYYTQAEKTEMEADVKEQVLDEIVIPEKVSDLENDSDFQTDTDVASSIGAHNQSNTAHQDIRNAVSSNTDDIDDIEEKIPNQASASNQLADKDFVNSSIATNTANFRGTFNSVAELEAYSGVKTPNDYAFVIIYDTEVPSQVKQYDRYKYNGTAWVFEYTLNNSSFTANQWAAIQSGITALLVGQITTNQNAIAQILTDLVDYVKNTDYASSTKGGTIKTAGWTAIATNNDGTLYPQIINYVNYLTANNNAFISKGTFENALTGKGLVKSTTISSESTDDNVATPKSVYDYIESLDIEEVAF